jgi:hypothetical protein
MGPSGAGKTVLISTLTLDALFGRASGSVTLNGVPLTDEIFKEHAYVVVQHDKLWPYLTCRETMRYAAELYAVESATVDAVVDAVIDKLGLRICAETRNARLSGGQQRRLSLALALLKNPTLLFLGTCTHNSSSRRGMPSVSADLTPHFLLFTRLFVPLFTLDNTHTYTYRRTHVWFGRGGGRKDYARDCQCRAVGKSHCHVYDSSTFHQGLQWL